MSEKTRADLPEWFAPVNDLYITDDGRLTDAEFDALAEMLNWIEANHRGGTADTCPTCGSPIEVVSSDEGTCPRIATRRREESSDE